MTTTTARIAAVYLSALQDRLGLEATADDCAVLVQVGPRTYQIDLLPTDPQYLRVSIVARHDSDLDEVLLAACAADVTRSIKGAKASVVDDLVVVACEMPIAPPACLPSGDMVVAVVPRILEMIDAGIDRFVETLQLTGIAFVSGLVGEETG